MTSVSNSTQRSCVRLIASTDQGHIASVTLSEGKSVMVGSGANCGIRLADTGIASIHCLIRMSEGTVTVQDWCTNLGTFVGSQQVKDEELEIPPGADVRIGRFRIEVTEDAPETKPARTPAAAEKPVAETVVTPPAETVPDDDAGHERDRSGSATCDGDGPRDVSAPPDLAPMRSATDATAVPQRRQSDRAAADPLDAASSHGSSRAPWETPRPIDSRQNRPPTLIQPDEIDPETVQLLRDEIECLRVELVERDRQLQEYGDLMEAADQPLEPGADPAEVERLVGRLEDLLDELARSDQRISALEELLRAEQELVRTQEEERRQIDAWLGDIEQRIVQREDEWKAERNVLTQRVSQLKAERDEADRQIQAAHQNATGGSAQDKVVEQLRTQVDDLQQGLTEANRRHADAERQLEELRNSSASELARAQVEEAVRAERLELAQARATLSRQQAELQRRLSETESAPVSNPRLTEADQRFHAFRQTLKELHQQEEQEHAGAKKPSLGSRLADLWRRLDGPTDTD